MIWFATLLMLALAVGCTYIKQSGEGNTVEVREASLYVESDITKGDDGNAEQKVVEAPPPTDP